MGILIKSKILCILIMALFLLPNIALGNKGMGMGADIDPVAWNTPAAIAERAAQASIEKQNSAAWQQVINQAVQNQKAAIPSSPSVNVSSNSGIWDRVRPGGDLFSSSSAPSITGTVFTSNSQGSNLQVASDSSMWNSVRPGGSSNPISSPSVNVSSNSGIWDRVRPGGDLYSSSTAPSSSDITGTTFTSNSQGSNLQVASDSSMWNSVRPGGDLNSAVSTGAEGSLGLQSRGIAGLEAGYDSGGPGASGTTFTSDSQGSNLQVASNSNMWDSVRPGGEYNQSGENSTPPTDEPNTDGDTAKCSGDGAKCVDIDYDDENKGYDDAMADAASSAGGAASGNGCPTTCSAVIDLTFLNEIKAWFSGFAAPFAKRINLDSMAKQKLRALPGVFGQQLSDIQNNLIGSVTGTVDSATSEAFSFIKSEMNDQIKEALKTDSNAAVGTALNKAFSESAATLYATSSAVNNAMTSVDKTLKNVSISKSDMSAGEAAKKSALQMAVMGTQFDLASIDLLSKKEATNGLVPGYKNGL